MKKQCVGYCRVSGKGQTQGTGLERQEQAIRAYAKKAGYAIEQVYSEAFTGTKETRPAFTDMLADLLSNGCRVIVVERLDRLARDLQVQLQLVGLLCSKGVTLISADTQQDVTSAYQSDPMNKAILQIQGVFAELDKSLIVKKLKKGRDAVRAKSKDNKCEGRKKFGYFDDEKPTLTRMKQLRKGSCGKMPFGKIAKVLNDEDRPTRSGAKWSGRVIARILQREIKEDRRRS